ncbi:hypothetical protein [Brachybacterium hainanense]|uniref:Uncharacterized protein n=1 Tax=Brachybacterium hainanense TaxID=1541174 RepID=A0ABV6RDQ3_9MICO
MNVFLIPEEMKRLRHVRGLYPAERIIIAALSEADSEGVARFRPGGLATFIGRCPGALVEKAVAHLVEHGVFAEGSTSEELIVTFAYRAEEEQ